MKNNPEFPDAPQAQELGAVAVVTDQQVEGLDVPVIVIEDLVEAASRIATAFYDDPSRRMAVVCVAGTHGKTTTSWLIRGIFEELGQLTGMIGGLASFSFCSSFGFF
jgi:UDP-N-acetylmuramoyl-L-alanyl-D-glutamate--2,6-diaminopimelate ligase